MRRQQGWCDDAHVSICPPPPSSVSVLDKQFELLLISSLSEKDSYFFNKHYSLAFVNPVVFNPGSTLKSFQEL